MFFNSSENHKKLIPNIFYTYKYFSLENMTTRVGFRLFHQAVSIYKLLEVCVYETVGKNKINCQKNNTFIVMSQFDNLKRIFDWSINGNAESRIRYI